MECLNISTAGVPGAFLSTTEFLEHACIRAGGQFRKTDTYMDIHDISPTANSLRQNSPKTLRLWSDVCFVGGFASIIASIVAWGFKKGTDDDAKAERFGIFIGLWAPTFFILSNRFERYAEVSEKKSAGSTLDT